MDFRRLCGSVTTLLLPASAILTVCLAIRQQVFKLVLNVIDLGGVALHSLLKLGHHDLRICLRILFGLNRSDSLGGLQIDKALQNFRLVLETRQKFAIEKVVIFVAKVLQV